MAREIRNVIFDVGGVLTTYHEQDYYLRKGYDAVTAHRLMEATQHSVHWKEFDRGILTAEEILARMCKEAPDVADLIPAALGEHVDIVSRRDTAIPWIQSVKATGRSVYVLSNFSAPAHHSCAAALDFEPLMDQCYWSFEHHQIKPEIACYLDMLYTFGIDPTESVFIDDMERNLIPARAVGLHTIQYSAQEQAQSDLAALLEC